LTDELLQNLNNNDTIMITDRKTIFSKQRRGARILLKCIPAFIAGIAVLTVSCGGESDEMAREKLYIILDNDLKTLIAGIPKEKLLEKQYYCIVSYNEYEESAYSKKTVVDFIIFRQLSVKVERKYRYLEKKRMWERYFNDYLYMSDNSVSPKNK
jgi:hypothetical protein